jgi:hypothetical protein
MPSNIDYIEIPKNNRNGEVRGKLQNANFWFMQLLTQLPAVFQTTFRNDWFSFQRRLAEPTRVGSFLR